MKNKHASRKKQIKKDSKLLKKINKFDECDRDKRLSAGIYFNPSKKSEKIKTSHVYDMEEDWKAQTYQKVFNLPSDFETIIEKPYDEQYGTASHKRLRRKKRNFNQFYDKEMNFVQDKYNHIAAEQAKKEEKEVFQYSSLRDSHHLMSNGSRKILHNRMKTTVILGNNDQKLKSSGFLNAPVHERLYADNEMRRKKIEELKNNYRDHTQEGSFYNASSTAKISFANHQPLHSYRSVESIPIAKPHSARGKISDSLKKTIEAQSVEKKTARHRLLAGSRRENHPASMIITQEVSNKLYEDAKRRQSEKFESLQRNKRRERSASIQANPQSTKYLMRRFIKDFEKSLISQS